MSRKARMDLGLAKNLVLAGNQFEGYMTVLGKTISTDDFYEGQGRLDGAICEYNEEDKMNYLKVRPSDINLLSSDSLSVS